MLLKTPLSLISAASTFAMPSFEHSILEGEDISVPFTDRDDESGYASASSSEASIPDILFTKPHLAFLNRQLQNLEPQGMCHMSMLLEVSEVDEEYRDLTLGHYHHSITVSNIGAWEHRARNS